MARRRKKSWAEATNARLFTPLEFRGFKTEHQLHVLGVMGYAGRWRDQALKAKAEAILRRCFEAAVEAHGPRLVVCSGATNSGVLNATYALCAALGIKAMGVTPAQALSYHLAPMDYLIPSGERFGDESEVFLQVCDAFLLVGGGDQSEAESRRALERGAPLMIVEGFGGAGEVLVNELRGAPPPNLQMI